MWDVLVADAVGSGRRSTGGVVRNVHVLDRVCSDDVALHAWLDARADEVVPVTVCQVRDDRVCTGRADVGGVCNLCARRLRREYLREVARG